MTEQVEVKADGSVRIEGNSLVNDSPKAFHVVVKCGTHCAFHGTIKSGRKAQLKMNGGCGKNQFLITEQFEQE